MRRYAGDGCVEEMLDPTDVSESLGERGTLLWVDVEDPSTADVEVLVEEFGVHHLAAEDLMEHSNRPRLVRYADHSLLALRDPVAGPDGRIVSRPVDLVFGDGWLLSVRKSGEDGAAPTPVKVFQERFERERRGDGVTDEGFLVYVVVDTLIDRCFDVSDEIDDRMEAVEAVIFADLPAPGRVTEDLYRLRQDLVAVRRLAAPLRDALAPLLRGELSFIGEVALLHLRDVHDLALRLVETTDGQRDLLTGALEAHLALASNRINLVMKKATSWGAILVSGSLVAGIYGMNFENVPWNGRTEGFFYAVALIAAVSAALYRGFKRRDWL